MPNTKRPGGDFGALAGELYSVWTLDCLVELGYAVATDFVARPQLYQEEEIPESIVDLRMSWGARTGLANAAQRVAMMLPIFGRTDGLKPDASNTNSSFHLARKKLVDACIAFSERATDTGVSMLEDRVRSALVPLRAHFEGLQGRAAELVSRDMKAESDLVLNILRSAGVARVFGVPPAAPDWPSKSGDPNGAKLVEAASSALPVAADYKINYTRFVLLQRVAQEGAKSLPMIAGAEPSDGQLHSLISRVYSWGTSLRDFQQAA
jgi:hypothetical protein